MKGARSILMPGILCLFLASAPAPEDVPFRVNRVTDRVTVFIPGNHAAPAPTTVITTDRGLILIDTGLSPTLAEWTKKKIRQELGRDDVRTIVNTHSHFDHTDGNQVYPGAEIVGHESVPAAMRRFVQEKDRWISTRRERIGAQEEQLKKLDPKSAEALALEETIRFNRLLVDDLAARYVPTPPTKTFSDRLDLKVADLELRLTYFGRAHTDGDILIHIPALGVLFVGDLLAPDRLAVTADPAARPDVPRWLEVLGRVLETEGELKTVIGGHAMVKDRPWLAAQYRYMRDLWNAVKEAQASGSKPEAVEAEFPLEKAFSYLSPYFDLASKETLARHKENIQTYWRVGLKSAAEEIEAVLRQSGAEAARARFQETRTQLAGAYYIDEREFNALGYKLLRNDNTPREAVAVFEMNAEAFPQSWNVWDSLAEAYMWALGDRDKAAEYYQKSLDLNPGNQSAKDNLSRLNGYRLDVRGETREPSRFGPGEQTGLQGPYLGQESPGLKPEVFAPGVISTAGHMEFSITFSPDGKEIFFTRRKEPDGSNTLMVARSGDRGWTAPEEAAFAKGHPSNEPHITPDGRKLYFGSFRRPPGENRPRYAIWVTEKTDGGWGEARLHGEGMFVSSSRDGDLYMTAFLPPSTEGIVRYPFRDGAYGKPEWLGGGVNAPKPGAHGFIAPDESFMVFDSYNRPGGQGGEGDLWVSFRTADGGWGEAVNLGDEVNTPATNFCPSLSPDGKSLFYCTCRDIYWVSAEVIERLRPTTLGTAADQSAQAVEKLVDVGGYNLNFRIIQGQGPAILLESGGGMDANEWNVLAPRLAADTGATVIAYDRAGFGKSDLPETKYDLREDTAALWRGLRTLGLDRNLILVGHSYGGFLIRFEAAEHPKAVRGLVFVDPFTVEFVDTFGVDYCNNHPMMGKLPFDTSRPEKLSKLQRAMVRMVGAPDSNLADKIAVMRKATVPAGIPVRVITAGISFLPKAEEWKAWREAHERLTASMAGAKLILAEKSGHMIPFSQPDLVVAVVSEVTRLAK